MARRSALALVIAAARLAGKPAMLYLLCGGFRRGYARLGSGTGVPDEEWAR